MVQSVEVRKRPVQARSRARVDAILSAASEIISEVGSDGLKMSEVATRAKVPIGSVYQFFPNKSSIIHSLAQDSMEQVRASLALRFSNLDSLDDAIEKIAASVQEYYDYFKAEPLVRDIWCSTQGDKRLQEMDLEDSRANGTILFKELKSFFPKSAHRQLASTCFLCMQLTGATVRLAITQDSATAKRMLDQYILMISAGIRKIH